MRFKSYGFWTSLAAGLVVFAGVIGKSLGLEISEEIITDIVMGVAGVLVVLGIVKMPKSQDEQQDECDAKQEGQVAKQTKNAKTKNVKAENQTIKQKIKVASGGQTKAKETASKPKEK